MPSTRRLKLVAITLAVAVCTILYLSHDSTSQEFYTRTVAALDKKKVLDQEVAHTLQEVKDAVKAQEPVGVIAPQKSTTGNAEDRKSAVVSKQPDSDSAPSGKAIEDNNSDGEKSVAGRKTMKSGEMKDLRSGKETPLKIDKTKDKVAEVRKDDEEAEKVQSKEDHDVEVELNSILKKGPIIVFSKSYCPFSKKAKRILLEKYTIVPAPYVVELDAHPIGPGLQAALEKTTGRRTVPNVLISGRSIGGGDEIEALDMGGTLLEKVRTMGGKRIVEVKLAEK